MVNAQPRICHGEWDAHNSLGFCDKKTDYLISARPNDS